MRDAEWLVDLLRYGLLRASFVPPRPQREIRVLTRYRTSLVQERTAEVNRLQKVLEGATIKLSSVASNAGRLGPGYARSPGGWHRGRHGAGRPGPWPAAGEAAGV